MTEKWREYWTDRINEAHHEAEQFESMVADLAFDLGEDSAKAMECCLAAQANINDAMSDLMRGIDEL